MVLEKEKITFTCIPEGQDTPLFNMKVGDVFTVEAEGLKEKAKVIKKLSNGTLICKGIGKLRGKQKKVHVRQRRT